MNTQLSIGGIIQNGIQIGLKNFVSLILAVILFGLTFWIPYLNIGTFIAMNALVVMMAKDGSFSPTEIFDAKYRKNFGEFFLLLGFIFMGVMASYITIIGPLVLGIAWMLAIPLLLDKDMDPLKAIRVSNKLTYGHKWTIFLAQIVIFVGFAVVVAIFQAINETLGMIIIFILYILLFPILLGMQAYVYRELSQGADQAMQEVQ
jgi:hypothetical protein